MASMPSTVLTGSSSALSRGAGAAAANVQRGDRRLVEQDRVTPEASRASWALPTRTPRYREKVLHVAISTAAASSSVGHAPNPIRTSSFFQKRMDCRVKPAMRRGENAGQSGHPAITNAQGAGEPPLHKIAGPVHLPS